MWQNHQRANNAITNPEAFTGAGVNSVQNMDRATQEIRGDKTSADSARILASQSTIAENTEHGSSEDATRTTSGKTPPRKRVIIPLPDRRVKLLAQAPTCLPAPEETGVYSGFRESMAMVIGPSLTEATYPRLSGVG